MSVIKNIAGQKPFEVLPRELLQQCDKKRETNNVPLSLQAIGLLCNLQSYSENWEIHKTELYNRFEKNGRRQIENAWNELIDAGYIIQFKIYEGNKIEYIYYFSVEKISEEKIKELEEKHNSECKKRFDLKKESSTVQNEQYSHGKGSPTVQNEQYKSNSTDFNSTKRTDNIIHSQYNTHYNNTHEDNTNNYSDEKAKTSSSNYSYFFEKITTDFNIKLRDKDKKELLPLLQNFNDKIIEHAIYYSSEKAEYPLRYLKTILNTWKKQNVKSLAEAQECNPNSKVNRQLVSKEMTPKWLGKQASDLEVDEQEEYRQVLDVITHKIYQEFEYEIQSYDKVAETYEKFRTTPFKDLDNDNKNLYLKDKVEFINTRIDEFSKIVSFTIHLLENWG